MDPIEKAASELNHHIAGLTLIVIALCVLAGQISRLRFARYVWPLCFILLGVFLLAWSDAEIWPRGPLSWSWLIHHDAEARQHKIYALIVIAIGVLEWLRARDVLSPVWKRWSFPALALCGALLLTMHAHGGTSGLPAGWNPDQSVEVAAAVVPAPAAGMAPHQHEHHHDQQGPASAAPLATHAEHMMTASMMSIQRQHMWMTLVGICLALFKFLADGMSKGRLFRFAWPTAMAWLGVLLLLYRE
jgi:hypothetical protein